MRLRDAAPWAPALALLGWVAHVALHSPPSFDGALSLRVAASLVSGGGYGFDYDGRFPFPAQTDGPVVLPEVLAFRLFGIGIVTSQAVGLLYLAGFALLVPRVLSRAGAPGWACAIGLAACLALPGCDEYLVNGYGEIPMLAWLLAGLWAAMRATGSDRPFRAAGLAGLCLGLACLTKTVALLSALPIAACACLELALPTRRTPPRRAAITGRVVTAATVPAGLLVPLLAWELFRLACLGVAGWSGWWRLQLGQVAMQSGAGGLDIAALPLVLAAHLHLLSQQTSVPATGLCLWLALPWACAAWRFRQATPAARLALAALLVCSLLYAVWWLLITPPGMAWLRRLLPGLMLQTMLVTLLAARPGNRWVRLPIGAALAVQLALLGIGLHRLARLDPGPHEADFLQAVAAIRALPADATLFGVGWWQSPALSLIAGRPVSNIERWTPERLRALVDPVFVADAAALSIGNDAIREVRATAILSPILSNREAMVARIAAIDPDRPLRMPSTQHPDFDAARDPQAQGSGWYPSAGGWAWLRPRSRLMLAYAGAPRLIVDAAFWSELFPAGPPPPRLHVLVPTCLDTTLDLPGAGLRRLVLPLSCPPGLSRIEVRFELDRAMPIPRQLDADTRLRGFEVSRVATGS